MVSWALLLAAVCAEVSATVSLKLSNGFSRLVPTGVVIAGYMLSFYLLSLILTRGMKLGIVYACWSALGVAIIVIVDVLFFDERLTLVQVLGLFAVVIGVAALELGGATTS